MNPEIHSRHEAQEGDREKDPENRLPPEKESTMKNPVSKRTDDIAVVLCGEAGQGVQTVERLLVNILKRCRTHVFATKEYMSRVRGGSNSTEIRVSSRRISARVDRIDVFVPFHRGAIEHLRGRITEETMVVADRSFISEDACAPACMFVDVPFLRLTEEVGGRIYLNAVAAGVVLGLFGVAEEVMTGYVRTYFSRKGEDVAEKNAEAIRRGYAVGQEILGSGRLDLSVAPDPGVEKEVLLTGAQAVGFGALAGGCRFLASYPMSPSTGVMVFLSEQTEHFDLIVEQAEDEISAVNMALGASYAGARAMVTTSGGGFALMTEAISLSGMIETPVVVHLAQRPGPATGLPTRTEQADLQLALYAGHGEFPRAIFAPGNLEQALRLTHRAFDLADKYQVPVFVLTDQYLIDTITHIPPPEITASDTGPFIVKTQKGYRRFLLTDDGLSPRGIPGYGEGLVGVDSDEHDEDAHITEDLRLRSRMVEKRLKKGEGLLKEALAPEWVGPETCQTLVIGWGSTYPVLKEALALIGREDVALLHFHQVYPLHPDTRALLERAKQRVLIENNATGQLGNLIRLHTGIAVEEKFLKYSGMAFSLEEVVEGLEGLL